MADIYQTATRNASTSFYLASLLFPRDVRHDVYVLYAFVRMVDDSVDAVPPDRTAFARYRNLALEKNKTGHFDPFADAFTMLVSKYDIPQDWIRAYFDTQEADLTRHNYRTFNDLLEFTYGVAEVIGLMMSKIMRVPPAYYPYARLLGRTMQLVNIIRDIREDASAGKTYIPEEDIRRFGLKAPLTYPSNPPEALSSLIRFECSRAADILEESRNGFAGIPRRVRLPVLVSADMYARMIGKIRKNPLEVMRRRVKVPRCVLLWIIARRLMGI